MHPLTPWLYIGTYLTKKKLDDVVVHVGVAGVVEQRVVGGRIGVE